MKRGAFTYLFGLLAIFALIATACGDDDDGDTSASGSSDDGGGAETDAGTADDDSASSDDSSSSDDDGGDDDTGTDAAAGDDDGSGGDSGSSGSGDGFTCVAKGGTLRFGEFSEVEGFDPNINRGSGSSGGSVMQAVYDSLFLFDESTGQVVPHIATGMETEDSITWTMTLRDDVFYSDGTQLTADAVAQHIERHKSEENVSASRSDALQVESTNVIDDTTLEMTLTAANGSMPLLFTEKLGNIPNPNAYDLPPEEFNVNPPEWIGVGPFVVSEWVQDDHLTMVRNENYWRGPERPCVDAVEFVPIPDAGARYDALLTGDIEVGFFRAPRFVVDGEAEGLNTDLIEFKGAGQILYMNTTVPGLDDVRIRQAIAQALDPQIISNVVDEGKSFPTRDLFPADSPWLNPDVDHFEYDVDAASALVEEYESENGDLTLTMSCHTAPERRVFAELIAAELPKVGIDVELDIKEITEYVGQVNDGNYEMGCWAVNLDADPEPIIYSRYHTGESRNSQYYSNPRVDELLEIGRASTDFDERKAAYDEIQEIFAEEIPGWVYGFNPESLMYDDSRVGGVRMQKDVVLLADEAYFE